MRNSISNPPAESQGGAENISSVRQSRRVVLPKPPTTKDVADWLDGKDDVRRKWRRALQDKNIGIRDVEEKLGITDKNESAYYAKDRAFGKNEHELTVLQKQEVEPIVEKIHKSGGEVTDGTRLAALAPTFADVFAVAKHRLEKSHWTMSIISRYKWRI